MLKEAEKIFCAGLLLLFGMGSGVVYADFQAGVDAVKKGDFATALREWKPLAQRGVVDAQLNLGLMYVNGDGVPQDYKEAVKWFEKAVEQGDAMAQYTLGLMYVNGDGVPQDYKEAARLYEKAAEQGYAKAQYNLGSMYGNGKGVLQDYVKAHMWWNIAASSGHKSAAENRGIVEKMMTASQKAEAQRLAVAKVEEILRKQDSTQSEKEVATPINKAPKELVLSIQRKLHNLGYKPGPLDGKVGAKTTEAIKQFQRDYNLTPTGHVSDELLTILIALEVDTSKPPKSSAQLASTGTGFFINEYSAITNYHVVEDCSNLKAVIDGKKVTARVDAIDETTDIALIRFNQTVTNHVEFRLKGKVELGEKVYVAGFPLRGLLAKDMNFVSGEVSAMAGMDNDRKYLQISAPVQPGNSGGPLLDEYGNVVGMVVAKLNAVEIAKTTGDIPQNINFAIKGSLLKSFLDINGANYKTSNSTTKMTSSKIAHLAQDFTMPIECYQ